MQSAALADVLELTDENVELVLDEIRPYLMAGDALCCAAPPCSKLACATCLHTHVATSSHALERSCASSMSMGNCA